jgi:hypothetical protein
MGEILTDITFEKWIEYVFDHPVVEGKSYFLYTDWDINDAWWSETKSPATTIAYMTRLFENPREILKPFSDAQLNQSFHFLIDPGQSWHLGLLTEQTTPLADRLYCIQLIYNLFEQVFAVRCSPNLSKGIVGVTPPADKNPLNFICFMWWDIAPIYGAFKTEDEKQIANASFEVMKKTLQLDSIACQESSLHGLGHADFHYSAARKAIDDWLLTHQDTISDRLKTYALSARDGNVM